MEITSVYFHTEEVEDTPHRYCTGGNKMGQPILSPELKKKYESMRGLLQACLVLTDKCKDTEAYGILRERLAHLQSAALFVIVGEVKSGKSSFVNALLGEEVCQVAPDPCTACIQELVYGDERTKTTLGDNWERITLPKKVLMEISIVDTPGTNSIIRNHSLITENYIPQSDLVIFVFPAKNPHTATAWDLLTFVRKDWHRKIVFVLQQADLTTQRELATNQERLKQYARERGVQNPMVFTVSAKWESEGQAYSGFTEFREFLRNTVQTGEVWRMKVEGARDTVRKIVSGLVSRLRAEQAVVADDRTFYENLLFKLVARREKVTALRRLVVDSLCQSYDRLASKLEKDFEEGLAVGTILRRSIPFLRDKDVKTWLSELQSNFERTAKQEIEKESMRISEDISNEMKSMFSELSEAITHRQNAAREVSATKDSDRIDILSRLQQQLQELRIADIIGDKGIQSSDIGALSLAGGGIAAFGAVIALATKIMILDITGGILALVGAGLIAVSLIWKRSTILDEVSKKLAGSRDEFRYRLDKEIAQIFEKLFMEIEHRLKEPLSRLDGVADRTDRLIEEAEGVKAMAEGI